MCSPCTDKTILIYSLCILEEKNLEGTNISLVCIVLFEYLIVYVGEFQLNHLKYQCFKKILSIFCPQESQNDVKSLEYSCRTYFKNALASKALKYCKNINGHISKTNKDNYVYFVPFRRYWSVDWVSPPREWHPGRTAPPSPPPPLLRQWD